MSVRPATPTPTLGRTRWQLCALLVLTVLCRADAQEDGEDLCGACHTTGRVDNPRAAVNDKDEADTVFCSVAMDRDDKGLGNDFLVCENCKTPSEQARAQREFDRQRSKREQWLAERREEVDKKIGHEMVHVQTRHFVIAWDVPKIKVDRRVLTEHDGAHLYAQRAEELFQQIMDLHGINDRRTAGTTHYLYIFEREKDAQTAASQLTNGGNGARSSMYGKTSRMVTFIDSSKFKKDEEFHQFFSHVVSHHVHNDVELVNHWLVKRYGWIFEGLGHFIEIRNFGAPNTWCHQEVGSGIVHWKGKGWEANVKKAVQLGEQVPFADLLGKAADTLTPQEHQFAWSYVDYLMWYDPAKMPKLLALMKGRQLADRDAIESAYGLSIPKLQEGWEEFVRAEYSPRSKKGPQPREPRQQ